MAEVFLAFGFAALGLVLPFPLGLVLRFALGLWESFGLFFDSDTITEWFSLGRALRPCGAFLRFIVRGSKSCWCEDKLESWLR